MKFIYNIAVYLYTFAIFLASPLNTKAKLWIKGRREWRKKLASATAEFHRIVWVHCASLGEFEQGRPLIEKIKEELPDFKIILTFFSPSGYEIRKNYPLADYICYLPADTKRNAVYFIRTIRCEKAIFIKYEFWNNYISELNRNAIPVYLVSGIFRPDQHFFRWYGSFFLNILKKFTHIFVQDSRSASLLSQAGVENITVAGDTRFDRVAKIASSASAVPAIEQFLNGEKAFLAGSSWNSDEDIIAEYINANPGRMKWIFAPHEPSRPNIERLEKILKPSCIRLSQFSEKHKDARILLIDTVGILSSAYRYAHISAVGGGFGKGIHNILEPACWGVPVLFGPNHLKFKEAIDLINLKGAFCFRNYKEFQTILDRLLTDSIFYKSISEILLKYVEENRGSTEKIFKKIFQEFEQDSKNQV